MRASKAQLKCLRLANSALEASSKYIKQVPVEIQTSSDFAALCSACDEISETKFCNICRLTSFLNGTSCIASQVLVWISICNASWDIRGQVVLKNRIQ